MLSCIPGVAPRVGRIEAVYIGSILEDIRRDKPISAGVTDLEGIKIVHTITEPVFMEYFLQRMGLHELLSDLDIDFVIGDTVVYSDKYFSIQKSMGYAIKNIRGLRFAMVCNAEDSLTVQDQISISLLKERSDILWVIDKDLLAMSPAVIKFHVDGRALSDTSISTIKVKDDANLMRKIRDFRARIEKELNSEILLGEPIDDHVFSTIVEKEKVDVIIYPQDLFTQTGDKVSMTLRALMESIAFETKFRKTEMEPEEISEICTNAGYLKWGNLKETNIVLVPDAKSGEHIFDYYYERKENED